MTLVGPARVELGQAPSAYLPFRSVWGRDAYTVPVPFDLDPATTAANSTSGSPVAVVGHVFAGLLQPTPGSRFVAADGEVRLELAAGHRAFVTRDGDIPGAWARYRRAAPAERPAAHPPAWSSAVEYCTWVEQKAEASSGPPELVVDEDFVRRFLDRIAVLDLPPGVVTLDSGWFVPAGEGGAGDWEPDQRRFPDLSRVAEAIRDAGHVPGIWIAPALADPRSRTARRHPEDLGGPWSAEGEAPEAMAEWRYLRADRARMRSVFRRLANEGFRKLKLDILYGERFRMLEVLRACREAVDALGEETELEHHIPDVFSAMLADVVRTNDVLIGPGRPWRELTETNWSVCEESAADRILNLDHVGGNDPRVGRDDFLAHWRMFDARLRRNPAMRKPVVSLLPDRFDDEAIAEIREGLWAHERIRTAQEGTA